MRGILIERDFTQFVVFAEDSILSALSKITANQSRLIFVVSESGILRVLTDGDFRRWIPSAARSTEPAGHRRHESLLPLCRRRHQRQ